MKIRPLGTQLFHTDGQRQIDRQTDKHDEAKSLLAILRTSLKIRCSAHTEYFYVLPGSQNK